MTYLSAAVDSCGNKETGRGASSRSTTSTLIGCRVRLPGTAREGSQGSVMGEGRGGECGKEGMFVGRETGVLPGCTVTASG